MISILLKGNSTEVVVSLISNLGSVVEKVGNGAINEKLSPTLTTLTTDKIWRVRLAVVEFVSTLVQHIDKEVFVAKLQDVIVSMLGDSVFAIREETTNSLITLAKKHFD